jgi:transcriptional regulator with XRE-family HTH domain
MTTFGKKLRECRENQGLSQRDLAKLLNTSYSVIGKYERGEMQPSIEAVTKIAKFINTTVGYLVGEVQQADTFKDPEMLNRLQKIHSLPEKDKDYILYAIDNLLASATTRLTYAK